MAHSETPTEVASPCVGVCRLLPGTDVCEGCFRTAPEIGRWRDADEGQRLRILALAESRRRERVDAARPGDPAPLFRPRESD